MDKIYNYITRVLTSILVVVTIIFSMQSFSNVINSAVQNKKIEFVQNLFLKNDILPTRLLFQQRFYHSFAEYTEKYISSVLHFEFFPNNMIDTFAYIMLSMPNNIYIDNFDFNKNSIVIYCKSNDEFAIVTFTYNLNITDTFKDVEVISLKNIDNNKNYKIICKLYD